MTTVSVRYIVDNVGAAISFYTNHVGFSIDYHPGPGFAVPDSGWISFYLNKPADVEQAIALLRQSFELAEKQWSRRSARE